MRLSSPGLSRHRPALHPNLRPPTGPWRSHRLNQVMGFRGLDTSHPLDLLSPRLSGYRHNPSRLPPSFALLAERLSTVLTSTVGSAVPQSCSCTAAPQRIGSTLGSAKPLAIGERRGKALSDRRYSWPRVVIVDGHEVPVCRSSPPHARQNRAPDGRGPPHCGQNFGDAVGRCWDGATCAGGPGANGCGALSSPYVG